MRRRKRAGAGGRRIVVAIVTSWLLLGQPASFANGRFPEANQLVVDPGDPAHLVVRTTFGILGSADAGATWTWICETAVSPLGLLDEEIMITAGGRTSIALSNGINVGDRALCNWERAQGDVVGQQVTDMVRSASDPSMAYAAVAVTVDGFLAARIARTTNGTSWSFVGDVLLDTVPLTIEIAPSRPQRLYLGADVQDFALGNIEVSDDAGMTWTPHAAPGDAQSVYLSAVDPANADRIYVRSKSPEDNTLYVSEDAGVTWTPIYNSADAPLTGFALSPDGMQVAVGSDNGMAILKRVETTAGSSVFTVERTNPTLSRCLTWTAAGLYVCASEASDGFTIGLSTDEAVTFRPLLQTAHLAPASCPATSTITATCPDQWCPLAMTLGASCDATPAPRDAGVDRPGPVAAMDHAGCSCDVTPASPASAAGLLLAVAAFLALRRRPTGYLSFDPVPAPTKGAPEVGSASPSRITWRPARSRAIPTHLVSGLRSLRLAFPLSPVQPATSRSRPSNRVLRRRGTRKESPYGRRALHLTFIVER